MKKTYIIPALYVTKLNVENMMAVSGPGINTDSANQGQGMDTKGINDWDIWGE